MCEVVNKYKENFDIYIGRGSVWGNPYRIGVDGDRDVVIKKYTKYLWDCVKDGTITIEDLLKLDGKRLGCFCKPKSCHGDVIVRAVKWALKQGDLNE